MNDERGDEAAVVHRSSFIVRRLRMTDLRSLEEGILDGRYRALARAVSLVEREHPDAARLLADIYPATGNARIVGITGSPGSGKSTLVAALAKHYRKQGKRVGIIAVD